jgi:hypothetical protein
MTQREPMENARTPAKAELASETPEVTQNANTTNARQPAPKILRQKKAISGEGSVIRMGGSRSRGEQLAAKMATDVTILFIFLNALLGRNSFKKIKPIVFI